MNFYQKEYNAIYRGIVVNTEDPMNLGRCRIRVPSIHGQLNNLDVLPWARPIANSTINGKRGSINIPDVGDVLWVVFEGGDTDYPAYLGGMYANEDIIVDRSKVILYIEEDNAILYDRENKSYIINVKDTILNIDDESASMSIGESVIKATKDDISASIGKSSIKATTDTLSTSVGETNMVLTSEGITIKGKVTLEDDLYVCGEITSCK